jgi:hypothetical protein
MNWDNDKNLDKLIEENLVSYEEKPSPWVWDAVLKDIPPAAAKPVGFLHGSGLIVGIGSAMLIGAASLAFFLGVFDSKGDDGSFAKPANNAIVKNITSSPGSPVANPSQKHAGKAIVETQEITNKDEHIATGINHPKQQSILSSHAATEIIPVGTPDKAIQTTEFIGSKENSLLGSQKTSSIFPGLKNALPPETAHEELSLAMIRTYPVLGLNERFTFGLTPFGRPETYTSAFRNAPRKNYDYYSPKGDLALSLYLQSDYLSGSSSENVATQRNLAGLGLLWSKNSFIFESGLLFCRENRDQNYNIRYNEFMGTYMRLDSIVFSVQNGQLTTSNIMSQDSVFTQEQKNSNLMASSSYTYMSIPLLAGVEYQKSHLSFTLKTGVLLGIQVNKKENTPVSPENAKVTQIERLSPGFMTSNLQWVLRAGMNWYISDQYGILVEPGVQGYLSKPYERTQGSTERPVYFGLKAGIFRKF